MRSISMAAAIFVAAAGLAFAQVDTSTSNPAPATPPAAEGTTTQPDATTAQPSATDQQTQSADQRVICRTVASTESRLRRQRQRICGTRAQWEEMQDRNARQMQQQNQVQQSKG